MGFDAAPLHGALIGFGAVAQNAHAPAFRSDPWTLAAIAERDPGRRRAARQAFPRARLYESLAALLADEKGLSFVDIATPPFLHGAQALQALEAGCHVLCEKPLTLNPEEFSRIAAASARAGLAVYTVNNWAFSPQWLKIAEVAGSGLLGDLRRVEIEVLRRRPAPSALPGDWRLDPRRAGGGIAVDHGWHCLYLLHRLLGGGLREVSVEQLLRPAPAQAEDEASVFLSWPGARARLRLTWRAAERSNRVLLEGSRGRLELNDDCLEIEPAQEPARKYLFTEKLSAGSAHPSWFSAMLPAFREAMADPARRARGLEEGRFCLETLGRIYAAAPDLVP